MQTSERTGRLMAAIAQVQAELPTVRKDAAVKIEGQGSRTEHFARHEDIWTALQPITLKHGLSVVQDGEPGANGSQWLVTRVTWHGNGEQREEWKEGRVLVASPRPGFRDFGAYWSYVRRIALLAAFGIVASGEDPDQGEADKTIKDAKPPRADKAARPQGAPVDADAEANRAIAELAALPAGTTLAQIEAIASRLKGLRGMSPATHAATAEAFNAARARFSR
jgi:hypothetical protein